MATNNAFLDLSGFKCERVSFFIVFGNGHRHHNSTLYIDSFYNHLP